MDAGAIELGAGWNMSTCSLASHVPNPKRADVNLDTGAKDLCVWAVAGVDREGEHANKLAKKINCA